MSFHFRVLIMTMLLTLLPAIGFAERGSRGGMDSGGGGDPLANEFMLIGRSINKLIPKELPNPYSLSRAQFAAQLDEIELSLETKKPLVSFADGNTVDCFGFRKLGCVKDGFIFIAREGWSEKSTLNHKIQLTAMELFMRLAQPGRYEKAEALANQLSTNITLAALQGIPGDVAVDSPAPLRPPCANQSGACLAGVFSVSFIPPEKAYATLGLAIIDSPVTIEMGFISQLYSPRCRLAKKALALPSLPPSETGYSGADALMVHMSYDYNASLPLTYFTVIKRGTVATYEDIMSQARSLIEQGLAVRIQSAGINKVIIEGLSRTETTCH